MSERDWADIAAESDWAIDQVMAERRAHEAGCTCGAVDVEGASHLDWCFFAQPDSGDLGGAADV